MINRLFKLIMATRGFPCDNTFLCLQIENAWENPSRTLTMTYFLCRSIRYRFSGRTVIAFAFCSYTHLYQRDIGKARSLCPDVPRSPRHHSVILFWSLRLVCWQLTLVFERRDGKTNIPSEWNCLSRGWGATKQNLDDMIWYRASSC